MKSESSESEQSFLLRIKNQNISFEPKLESTLSRTQRWIAHASFLLFGIVNVFQWNAILVQTMYFQSKMRKSLQDAFNPTLCSFSMGALILGNTLNIGVVFRFKSKIKIISSLVVYFICIATITCTVWFEAPDITFFVILMVIALLANIVQPIMMSALYEDLRVYPKFSFDMFNMGIAASGLISALLSIVLVAANINQKLSVMIFFIIAKLLILICLIVYYFIMNSNFYKNNLEDDCCEKTDSRSALDKFKSMYKMMKLKWIDALSLFFCMGLTLFVYPSLILTVRSVSKNNEWKKYFFYVVCFLSYGLGDTVGKYINIWLQWPKSQTKSMLAFSLSRFAFIFLFLLCFRPNAKAGIFIMNSDAFPLIWTFILAVTNAHLTNRTLSTPYLFESADDQIDCLRMLVFTLSLGLTFGAFCSFLVQFL